MTKTLTLIAAAASKNNGIGVNNGLPWRLPQELSYFTRVTKGAAADEKLPPAVPQMNACIMGRRSWEAIPPRFRPFAGRYNIVITSNPGLFGAEAPPYTITQPSIRHALEHIDSVNAIGDMCINRIFIVGGGAIYAEALKASDCHIQVLLTKVEFADADKCDVFFPELDTEAFPRQSHERLEQVAGITVPRGIQTEKGISYEFQLYEQAGP
ncbi:dihydrofolate reductase [Coemansia sp. RSA 552]|nr:dihydrofolate reductase [Coemansia sp. RSA 552]